jgi:hypothetical protein
VGEAADVTLAETRMVLERAAGMVANIGPEDRSRWIVYLLGVIDSLEPNAEVSDGVLRDIHRAIQERLDGGHW